MSRTVDTIVKHERVTSTNPTAASSATAPDGARGVILTVTGAVDAQITLDGTTPTATNGLVLKAGAAPALFDDLAIKTVQALAVAAGTTNVDIAWVR